MNHRHSPASLADVAVHAGVSAATASKALNGRADVNEATRARVEEAARVLGYVPNSLARGLLGARTGTVGIITSDLEGRFAIPILMGVEDALGIDRILSFLCDARGDELREDSLIASLLARRVDGLILVGRQNDRRRSIGRLPVPVVYAYAESDDAGRPSIFSASGADASRTSAARPVTAPRRTACAGRRTRSWMPDCRTPPRTCSSGTGRRGGVGRRRRSCWTAGPRSTR
jgi:DNA-binding LacI/PurR family transcriptional regulator